MMPATGGSAVRGAGTSSVSGVMADPYPLPFTDAPTTVPGPGDHGAAATEGPQPGDRARRGPVERTDPGPARSFQASAGIQGRQFADQCDTLLGHLGFELRGRRVLAEVGVEVDQEAFGPGGTLVWFEYKGSVQGNRPGLRRTDTVKKAVANGALLAAVDDHAPYVVITSHLPASGAAAAMLSAATELGYLADVVCLYDPTATARLKRW